MNPLLSICIPTYNRVDFLEVMLAALLPQVADVEEEVEVWVLDNASTDSTSAAVASSQKYGPVKYHRNTRNLGPLANVIKGPSELATGEYVWVLGDHNLLRPGGLERVLDTLRRNNELNVFYANFRCASFPAHWPTCANGGYDGDFDYVGNDSIVDRRIARWSELVKGRTCAYCTQLYAHIVRTVAWKKFWANRNETVPYRSALTTYPHTVMISELFWNAPTYYIGNPVITIFNGAQSWGSSATKTKVYSRGLPDLISRYARLGLSQESTKSIKKWANHMYGKTLLPQFNDPNQNPVLLFIKGIPAALSYPYLFPALWNSFIQSERSSFARNINRGIAGANRVGRYLFRDCRPARWFRGLIS